MHGMGVDVVIEELIVSNHTIRQNGLVLLLESIDIIDNGRGRNAKGLLVAISPRGIIRGYVKGFCYSCIGLPLRFGNELKSSIHCFVGHYLRPSLSTALFILVNKYFK